MSFQKIMTEFDKRFRGDELPETLQAKFQVESQTSEESLRDWSDRIMVLGVKAYQGLPEPWVIRHVVMRFCLGCIDTEAGQHAALQKPVSISEAIDAIEWHQCIHKSNRRAYRSRTDVTS